VAKRIHDWQPTKDERKFDDIAWVDDVLEARRLSKEQQPADVSVHA